MLFATGILDEEFSISLIVQSHVPSHILFIELIWKEHLKLELQE